MFVRFRRYFLFFIFIFVIRDKTFGFHCKYFPGRITSRTRMSATQAHTYVRAYSYRFIIHIPPTWIGLISLALFLDLAVAFLNAIR